MTTLAVLKVGYLKAENARLRAAIRWALGEVPDDKGQWFGDNRGPDAEKARKAPYWWRTNLRRISGDNEQTAGGKS